MTERRIRQIKPNKPTLNSAPNQRNANDASPVESPTPSGNLLNSDKDYTKWSEVSPENVNKLHSRDDTDKSFFAHHHTLGLKRNQASPGDHGHTGTVSRKLGYGMNLTLAGAKGSNVALTNLIAMLGNFITFTDSTT